MRELCKLLARVFLLLLLCVCVLLHKVDRQTANKPQIKKYNLHRSVSVTEDILVIKRISSNNGEPST